MAAARCYITTQRAAIGSEIKTLSSTADGDGSKERERQERESRLLGKWQTNVLYPCVCVHVCHPTDWNASVADVHSQG